MNFSQKIVLILNCYLSKYNAGAYPECLNAQILILEMSFFQYKIWFFVYLHIQMTKTPLNIFPKI